MHSPGGRIFTKVGAIGGRGPLPRSWVERAPLRSAESAMRLKTRLTEKLGVKHPILLAPMNVMAGGKLAAAVSDAGGLGLHRRRLWRCQLA